MTEGTAFSTTSIIGTVLMLLRYDSLDAALKRRKMLRTLRRYLDSGDYSSRGRMNGEGHRADCEMCPYKRVALKE